MNTHIKVHDSDENMAKWKTKFIFITHHFMDLGWNDILWRNPRETHPRDKLNGRKPQHRETTKHYQTKSYLTSVRYLLFYSIVFLLVCSFTIMFVHWVEFSHLSLPSGVKSHSWVAVTGWRRDYTLDKSPVYRRHSLLQTIQSSNLPCTHVFGMLECS